MNLEQLRDAVASEATKRADRQAKETARLVKEVREKDAQIAEYGDVLRVMFNRCYAQSVHMCFFCSGSVHRLCDKLRSVGREAGE